MCVIIGLSVKMPKKETLTIDTLKFVCKLFNSINLYSAETTGSEKSQKRNFD